MSSSAPIATRRTFLQVTGLAGGGLLAGFFLPPASRFANAAQASVPNPPFHPNAFVKITPDNWVTVVVGSSEMGQGSHTALPMMLAEELDADWSRVRYEQSPTDPAYNNPAFGAMITGGSMTTPGQWEPQRKAGAAVREMLVAAAARKWSVEPASLTTRNGKVTHAASKRSATYGELCADAASLPVPKEPKLKDPKTFTLIGTSPKRLDAREKVDGTARFGIDVYVPNMLTAVIARPPQFGGKARSFDAAKAKAVLGVVGVYETSRGIAVAAKDFWSAKKGRDALRVEWDDIAGERVSSAAQRDAYIQRLGIPGTVAHKAGDVDAAQKGAAKRLEADYTFPYLAHAPMEPVNAVADVRADSCEIWTGTQFQTGDQMAAARITGLKPEQVKLHTTLLGGGFGRRANFESDFVSEAVHVSKAAKAPVKVVWTREDDIRGGLYRPSAACRFVGTLDATGGVTSWSNRVATQSITFGSPMAGMVFRNGVDTIAVEGAEEIPYAIPNVLVDIHTTYYNVPVLWWRSVGHSVNGFAVESFVDELAHAADKDPFAFRRGLLAKDKTRHHKVYDLLAPIWSSKAKDGVYRGVAVHESFGSVVGQIVEVSVSPGKELKIHRVVAAIDCGIAINPDLVKAQVESGIVFALSAALFGEITLHDGLVEQGNFDDYPLVRMYQSPAIEVHIVPGGDKPTGVGEPGVPPTAPALANAIFAASGQRLRSLPLRHHDIRIA